MPTTRWPPKIDKCVCVGGGVGRDGRDINYYDREKGSRIEPNIALISP